MHYDGWYPLAGGWLISLLVLAAFVVLIAWGIAWIVRRDTRYGAPPSAPQPPRSDEALEILRQRFARGEISEAEFISASRVLGGPEPPSSSGTGRTPDAPGG